MRRIPRHLDPVEIRVLGVLLEKEQTTPDVYPLTVNALVAACNQRSNREPVMDLDEEQVRTALGGLIHETLVWRTEGARSTRWRHNLDDRWGLERRRKAVITELLLRGAQTVGELRARGSRMTSLESTEEVLVALEALAEPPDPLVEELAREPGQKGTRWSHRLGPPEGAEEGGGSGAGDRGAGEGVVAAVPPGAKSEPPVEGRDEAVEELRRRLGDLERRLERLEARAEANPEA